MQGKSLYLSKAKLIEKKEIRLSEKIVVVSSALKKYFSERYKIDAKKIIVTPNAINAENVKMDEDEIRNLKAKYNLNENFVIGFVGSIFPYHGVDILIKSFRTVIDKHRNCKLLIVGDGEILPFLKIVSEKLKLGNSVIFTGNIAHPYIFNHIELMNICVMPTSNWYGSPVKIFEYGILGKAIVAPDNIPLRDVMENNKHGILIQPDETNLTEAILKLMENESLRITLGKNFQQKVLSEHTWEKMAQKILSSIDK